MIRETIVNKVRAVLNKAEGEGVTDEERQTFLAGAQRLIDKHNIDKAELVDADDMNIDREVFERRNLGNSGVPVALIWCEVASYNRCMALYRMPKRGHIQIEIFGSLDDIEIVKMLCDSLATQMLNDMAADRPRSRKAYATGWVSSIVRTIQDTQAQTYAESKALVPTATKAEEAARDRYGGRIRQDRNTELDPWDYHIGQRAGENADVGLSKLEDN